MHKWWMHVPCTNPFETWFVGPTQMFHLEVWGIVVLFYPVACISVQGHKAHS